MIEAGVTETEDGPLLNLVYQVGGDEIKDEVTDVKRMIEFIGATLPVV